MLRSVRQIGEHRGREALHERQTPQVLETLRRAAIIQSTESSNRIEGVTAPRPRIEALVAERTAPRDRSEQEIAGYRDVLNTIHANHAEMHPRPNLLLQLQRDLYRFTGVEAGQWKPVDNEISETRPDGTRRVRFVPVRAWRTPEARLRCMPVSRPSGTPARSTVWYWSPPMSSTSSASTLALHKFWLFSKICG